MDEMVGWHRRLNGNELEQAPGDGEGQGSRACCNLWGHKESDVTERLNHNIYLFSLYYYFFEFRDMIIMVSYIYLYNLCIYIYISYIYII